MTDGCHAEAVPISAHDRSFAPVADALVLPFCPQQTLGGDGTAGRNDRAEGPPITIINFLQLNRG